MTVPRSLLESLAGCDASDLVAISFREPEIAIRSGCDPGWVAIGCEDRELGDHRAAGADASDFVALVLGKPEIAIRSGCDPGWVAIGCEDRELGDPPCRKKCLPWPVACSSPIDAKTPSCKEKQDQRDQGDDKWCAQAFRLLRGWWMWKRGPMLRRDGYLGARIWKKGDVSRVAFALIRRVQTRTRGVLLCQRRQPALS